MRTQKALRPEPKRDHEEIEQVFAQWLEAVTSGSADEVLPLYEPDAILQPTLSGILRATPEQRKEYFERFTALPMLQATVNTSYIRLYGDTAVNSGLYTFSFLENGERRIFPARFSFTYAKGPRGWRIVDHHSSRVPDVV